jgi:hypothetical protein
LIHGFRGGKDAETTEKIIGSRPPNTLGRCSANPCSGQYFNADIAAGVQPTVIGQESIAAVNDGRQPIEARRES